MSFKYTEKIASLPVDQRLYFYELLAHNLTITIRTIWSEPDLSDAEKVDRIYWVNEILHRVTAKVYTLRLDLHEWAGADNWAMIEGYTARNKAVEKDVMAAIKFSYNCAAGQSKEGATGQPAA
jgi:hypothetical protein